MNGKEFLKAFKKSICVNAFMKLSKDNPFIVNNHENGLLIISLFCFKELITTIINGNIYAINIIINPAIAKKFKIFLFVPPIVVCFITLPPPVF